MCSWFGVKSKFEYYYIYNLNLFHPSNSPGIKWTGDYYIGEFKGFSYDGQGTYYWQDGRRYVGHFKDKKRFGQGTQYTRDGHIEKQGEWTDDKEVYYALDQ